MSVLTSLARALAADAGRAQPTRTVRHVHLSDRPLVLIPLQLAGEAGAPLAAYLGTDQARPRLHVVYEPRNRTQRFEFAAAIGREVILPYIDSYAAGELADDEAYPDAPQVLVPNAGGITFLRLFGRATRFRRTEGEWAVPAPVPLLGRWLTYFADRSLHPGSSALLPVTTVLGEHWASGQSATEDQSLAALLGWIDPPPGKDGPQVAVDAENPQIWPPAGPATDPVFDRTLIRLMTAVADAAGDGSGPRLEQARAEVEAALADQLKPTWDLMWRAFGLLRSLPEAASVARRWEGDRRSFSAQVRWIAGGGRPQPARDSAVTAAKRLERLEREQQQLAVQQAYDDPLVMAEYRMSGEAFQGTVTEVDPTRTDTSGPKAKLRPVLTVRTSDPVTVEKGEVVRRPDRPAQRAEVIGVTASGEWTQVVLELQNAMGSKLVPSPGSVPELGQDVLYTSLSNEFRKPAQFPEVAPWTHGGPPDDAARAGAADEAPHGAVRAGAADEAWE